MAYKEYQEYINCIACRPPRSHPHPNGLLGNEFTDRLLTGHINANGGIALWKQSIADLRFERLPDSTKPGSADRRRAARQDCYLPIGVPQSVPDYLAQVAALPRHLSIQDTNAAYKDLWRDCQGGHCPAHTGVVGKPYIRFLPPNE